MTAMIEVARIDTAGRLRHVRPERAAALAESIQQHGLLQPIKVVGAAGDYRLVFGEHRLVAVRDHLKQPMILATVVSEAELRDEADRQIEEIVENFVNFPLSVLEEAVALATWKDLYEAKNKTAGRGGRRTNPADGAQTEKFSVCFTEEAAAQLGCTDRKIRMALQIARGISETIRRRIADHPIADHQAELLTLAAEPEGRQASIAGLLLSDPPQARTVGEAIAVLDRLPKPRSMPAYAKVSERFSKLKEKDQHAFFAMHRDAIEAWIAEQR